MYTVYGCWVCLFEGCFFSRHPAGIHFWFLRLRLWSRSISLSSPAAAPIWKPAAVGVAPIGCSLVDARQIMPLSRLQQTGNAPKQVKLRASLPGECLLVACSHYRCSGFSICSHNASLFSPFCLFLGAAKDLNHKRRLHRDALSPNQPWNPRSETLNSAASHVRWRAQRGRFVQNPMRLFRCIVGIIPNHFDHRLSADALLCSGTRGGPSLPPPLSLPPP